MFFLGIDPGSNGGYGLIDDKGNFIDCGDMTKFINNLIRSDKYPAPLALIEHQRIRGNDTRTQVFNVQHLIRNYGEWRGLLLARGYVFDEIEPISWQAYFSLNIRSKGQPKSKIRQIKQELIINLSKKLFPTAPIKLKKHDGMAVGLLLAEYARQQYRQSNCHKTLFGGE